MLSRLVRNAVGTHALHFDAERAFQLEKVGALILDEEGGGDSASAGAAGAANAVNEVFRHFGQIVISLRGLRCAAIANDRRESWQR